MISITIAVAIFGSILIWIMQPINGLSTYFAISCLYPQYLGFPVGVDGIDVTSGQILILVLLVRIATRPIAPGLLQLRRLDLLVGLSYVFTVLALLMNEPPTRVFSREGAEFASTVMVYAAARLSIRSREDVFRLTRVLIVTASILAMFGAYQAATGVNPYSWMREYSSFRIGEQFVRFRFGFMRADASFGNMIPFGLFFELIICLHIAHLMSRRQTLAGFVAILAVLLLGMLSSMSSAPIFALVISLAMMAAYPFRRYWVYALAGVASGCVALEVASDRHFYELFTGLALDPVTANYRNELFNEVMHGGMSGHWLAGYGYVGLREEPGHNVLPWVHQDLVNIYVYDLARSGLMALIPHLAMNVYYYFCLYRASKFATSLADKWTIWGISSGLVGWNIAMMTVAPLNQTKPLLYMTIAVAGAARYIYATAEEPATGTAAEPQGAPRFGVHLRGAR